MTKLCSSVIKNVAHAYHYSKEDDVYWLKGINAITGVKGESDFAIKEHDLFGNQSPGFDHFSMLARNNNDFKNTLIERFLINGDDPRLNKNKLLLPLELSDDWES